MKDRKIEIAEVAEVRQLICELVAEVTADLAKRSRNPCVLLDMAGDLEAKAGEMRQRFRQQAGR